MWSQVGLRKHCYKQSYWKWWNSSWAISNPKWFAVKVLYSICQQIWKTQQEYRTRNGQFSVHPKEGQCQKTCSNYCTIVFISHASKVMLKILQARLQKYMNWKLPGVQAGFRKGRGIEDQIANIHQIIEKAKVKVLVAQLCLTLCDPKDCSLPGSSMRRSFQARILELATISSSRGSFRYWDWTQVSHIAGKFFTVWVTWKIEKPRGLKKKSFYLCFIDYAKAFDCMDHNKLWKIL